MTLASNNDGIKALTLSEGIIGTTIFFVQMTMWTRINDRLPPEQQIGWRQALYGVFIWFQEGGLLVRYARLYPESRLGSVFRVLWGIFWVLVASRVLAK